jgi:hypothetical protein
VEKLLDSFHRLLTKPMENWEERVASNIQPPPPFFD